jgi:predicted metallopeptidase
MKRKRKGTIQWDQAPDIYTRLLYLIRTVGIDWVNPDRIRTLRSINANTRAYARIWGFAKVWQLAFDMEPGYVIEVISEKFDRLPQKEQDHVLLHELAHIPKNFSGSVSPHKRGKGNFHDTLHTMINLYDRHR